MTIPYSVRVVCLEESPEHVSRFWFKISNTKRTTWSHQHLSSTFGQCSKGLLLNKPAQMNPCVSKPTRGVSHCGLVIYIKKYLKAKEEESLKLKYFTMQKL
jgi:hypothetical protein